jgi:APA family basic amino acid/polyamine antiporter
VRDVIIAVLCIVFSILFIVYSRNTGTQASRSIGQIFGRHWGSWAEWMPFVLAGVALLVGIPVYRQQRSHMTQPQPAPPYR